VLDPCDGEALDLALAGTLVAAVPRARVVLRTAHVTLDDLATVAALGVSGCLIKLPRATPALCDALVLTGWSGTFVCSRTIMISVRAQLATRALCGEPQDAERDARGAAPQRPGAARTPRVRLSETEQVVVEGLVRGWTHRETARVLQARLGCGSERSVDRVVGELQARYGVCSPHAVVLEAAADGYLPDPQMWRDPANAGAIPPSAGGKSPASLAEPRQKLAGFHLAKDSHRRQS